MYSSPEEIGHILIFKQYSIFRCLLSPPGYASQFFSRKLFLKWISQFLHTHILHAAYISFLYFDVDIEARFSCFNHVSNFICVCIPISEFKTNGKFINWFGNCTCRCHIHIGNSNKASTVRAFTHVWAAQNERKSEYANNAIGWINTEAQRHTCQINFSGFVFALFLL